MNSTTENTYQNIDSKRKKPNKGIDYRLLIIVLFSRWYVLLLAFLISFGGCWIYLKKAERMYEGYTTILLKDPKAKNVLDAQSLIGFTVGKTQSPVENEQVILQSASLTYNALKRIPWQVSYFAKGRLRTNNSYLSGPYIVIIDTTKPQVPGSIFTIDFTGPERFILKSEKNGGYLYKYSTGD